MVPQDLPTLARSERSDTGVATIVVLDADGRRLAKLEDGAWRDYLYLGDQLLAYFDDGEAEPTQVLTDHIGMPMIAVDGTGTVVWEAVAEPYGELRGTVGLSADPGLRYPGQWQDELDLEADCVGDSCTMQGPLQDSYSLFENGYRWYAPKWGRYGQADPIGLEGGVNIYGYARENPTGLFDSAGLSPRSCPECPNEMWIFWGVEASGVVELGSLGYGVNFIVFEARCLSSRRTCLFWTNCVRLFGVGAFLGASGGAGMIFNAPNSDDIAGVSGGGDVDLTTVVGPGGSGGIDVGASGSVSGRVQFTIGLGEAVTFNVCDVKKIWCRK